MSYLSVGLLEYIYKDSMVPLTSYQGDYICSVIPTESYSIDQGLNNAWNTLLPDAKLELWIYVVLL